MVTIFKVQIEFKSNDGQTWYALEFPERVEAEGETAKDVAEWTASHQNQSDDDSCEWRVMVWEGDDTCADPVHILHGSGR